MYQIAYNKTFNSWLVWRITKFGGEIVKTFKTERGAQNWVARRKGL